MAITTESPLSSVPADMLTSIELEHQETYFDPHVFAENPHATVAGCTEWIGLWRGHVLSIAWDWRLQEGRIEASRWVPPRTNIQLTDESGPLAPAAEIRELWALIESLDWTGRPRRLVGALARATALS
jgi:hypothetical protein